MEVRPHEGEPTVERWRRGTLDELVQLVVAGPAPAVGPRVVAVDGRSASGKTTLAARLHGAVTGSVVVHTDDVAWNHSFFDWADLLREGVLEPARRGEDVDHRPPGWIAHDRPGAIRVPAGTGLLLVEGVGAGRRELTDLLDAVVWVQSDAAEAESRGITRDIASGENGDVAQTTAFWHEWAAEEEPFVAGQRPWERACAVVLGTPPPDLAPHELLLSPGPATTRP